MAETPCPHCSLCPHCPPTRNQQKATRPSRSTRCFAIICVIICVAMLALVCCVQSGFVFHYCYSLSKYRDEEECEFHKGLWWKHAPKPHGVLLIVAIQWWWWRRADAKSANEAKEARESHQGGDRKV